MNRFNNLINKKYNSLEVVEYIGKDKDSHAMWKCRCDCGGFKIVKGRDLVKGFVKKCSNDHKSFVMIGKKFGKLKVLEKSYKRGTNTCYLCLCECGTVVYIRDYSLTSGRTKSCGCIKRRIKKLFRYSISHKRMYGAWATMIRRCKDPNHNSYKDYGARGIKVCKRWLKFENFLFDMGKRPEGMSIDRINNNGNYCKENCRWADWATQNSNKRNSKNNLN